MQEYTSDKLDNVEYAEVYKDADVYIMEVCVKMDKDRYMVKERFTKEQIDQSVLREVKYYEMVADKVIRKLEQYLKEQHGL